MSTPYTSQTNFSVKEPDIAQIALAWALGKKEQKCKSGGRSFPSPPLPPRSYFFAPFCPMPSRVFRACLAWLKETETTATQAKIAYSLGLLDAKIKAPKVNYLVQIKGF